ncbi:hypothetical protein GCM10020331_022220 [Ectobacillus funiculus]
MISIHPAIVIVIFLAYGAVHFKLKDKRKHNKSKRQGDVGMTDWINILIGFFLANVLGYGGGPASIPLMYAEIVTHHHWLTNTEFSNMLALGNALPGPIATKNCCICWL